MTMKRGSGILLHISSLPSPYGVGDFGPDAYKFVDFLAKSKQRYWQILPLTPTDVRHGNSPYSSPSAFAGNTLFISPDLLYQKGFLKKADLKSNLAFSRTKAEYKKATVFKARILSKAFRAYKEGKFQRKAFRKFCEERSYWLDDYVLFSFLKHRYKGKAWNQWPKSIRSREPLILEKIQKENSLEIEKRKFFQFLFYNQWFELRKYCHKNKISIIGDIPIYVNFDSVDVWTNPKLFKLDDRFNPKFVSGVPPDYFSKTGQRWGNPVFNWKEIKKQNYVWWLKRVGHNLKLYDYVRIDHFRGFVAYWEVSAREKTAMHGKWIKVPGQDFFKKVKKKYPNARIIAEDIGYITSAVRKLIKGTGFPGMKVLQFAFGESKYNNDYLPSTYSRNCVAYTGTHDNNTIKGWFHNEISEVQRALILKYIGGRFEEKNLHWHFIDLIMKSKANIVIFPMQDVLGLGEEAKMNKPATSDGNWQWRLSQSLSGAAGRRLYGMTNKYQRN